RRIILPPFRRREGFSHREKKWQRRSGITMWCRCSPERRGTFSSVTMARRY
ncbi:unnamed protein product, partial [Musa banksii]